MQCFGYEPGHVQCVAAYTSEQAADAAKADAEANDRERTDTSAAADAFWVEAVELV